MISYLEDLLWVFIGRGWRAVRRIENQAVSLDLLDEICPLSSALSGDIFIISYLIRNEGELMVSPASLNEIFLLFFICSWQVVAWILKFFRAGINRVQYFFEISADVGYIKVGLGLTFLRIGSIWGKNFLPITFSKIIKK